MFLFISYEGATEAYNLSSIRTEERELKTLARDNNPNRVILKPPQELKDLYHY